MEGPSSGKEEKRMVADAGFLFEAFREKPADYKQAWEKLVGDVQEMQKNYSTIEVNSLLLHEAMGIFKFQGGNELIPYGDIHTTPGYLTDTLSHIKYVTDNRSLYNKNYLRTILDQIFIASIYEESLASQTGLDKPLAMQHAHPPQRRPPVEDPAHLELLHETQLSRKITYKGEESILMGSADYALYYESQAKGSFNTNLVIVEAKKNECADGAVPELVSYLGIVSAARRKQNKANATLYGIASDGVVFRFCRVDNDGVFNRSVSLDWWKGDHKDRIFSMIRTIVREAALSSPSTTPIQDPAKRQLVLAEFGRPSTKVDFGRGGIEVFEIDKDEQDDYLIIGESDEERGTGLGVPEEEDWPGGGVEEQILGYEVGDGVAAGPGGDGAEDKTCEKRVTGVEGEGGKRKREDVGDEEDAGIIVNR
ncbi:hypothetical protein VE03_00187 [Pseudogymnoascus sp. 23342-1-I1]|nr:hypothetical protein VE03_00187 [Pseudogymnoascus sp. 23342-1-I1]